MTLTQAAECQRLLKRKVEQDYADRIYLIRMLEDGGFIREKNSTRFYFWKTKIPSPLDYKE